MINSGALAGPVKKEECASKGKPIMAEFYTNLPQKEKDNLNKMEKNPWAPDDFHLNEESDFVSTKEYSY